MFKFLKSKEIPTPRRGDTVMLKDGQGPFRVSYVDSAVDLLPAFVLEGAQIPNDIVGMQHIASVKRSD
jgi:hypothetical protein